MTANREGRNRQLTLAERRPGTSSLYERALPYTFDSAIEVPGMQCLISRRPLAIENSQNTGSARRD